MTQIFRDLTQKQGHWGRKTARDWFADLNSSLSPQAVVFKHTVTGYNYLLRNVNFICKDNFKFRFRLGLNLPGGTQGYPGLTLPLAYGCPHLQEFHQLRKVLLSDNEISNFGLRVC